MFADGGKRSDVVWIISDIIFPASYVVFPMSYAGKATASAANGESVFSFPNSAWFFIKA